jgi:hypothetical protein
MRKTAIIGVLAIGLLATGAQGAIWCYEMAEDLAVPQTNGSPAWLQSGDGYGDLAAGDFNLPEDAGRNKSGDPETCNAVYSRFSDTGSNGNDGYEMGLDEPAFTVDMCVHGEEVTAGSCPKSMGVRDSTLNGRGISIEPLAGGNSLRMRFFDGAGGMHGDVQLADQATGCVWRGARLSLPGDGICYVYDLGACAQPPYPLVAQVPMGGSGPGISGQGVHVNSLSGGLCMNSKWIADCLCIDTVRALGADDPAMCCCIPEPASLALLALGLVPVLRRRR